MGSFVKVFVTSTPIMNSTKYVTTWVKALVEMPEDCKRHFRVKTKYLMERLVRKFGWDYVSSLVPKSDLKMHKRLKNMRKELARMARRVSEDSGADEEDFGTAKSRHKSMDEILADSSDEDDEMLEDEAVNNKGKDKKKKKTPQTWIQEGAEGIVDLLAPTAAQAVSSTNPKTPKSDAETAKKSSSGFKINNDGKLIINDDDSEEETKKRPSTGLDDDSEEETFESLVSSKKRKIGSEAGSMKSGKSAMSGISGKSAFSKYTTGGSGIHRDLKADPGAEYRNKKGHGDVKKAGKHDPYAYIPMTHKALNKRKVAKAKGQFSSVINAAKKGASKGNKARVKDVKHLMKKMKV